MAVRRHGGPVMVVVTVIAVALHLYKSYGQTAPDVKFSFCGASTTTQFASDFRTPEKARA